MPWQSRAGPYWPLALIAAVPLTNSVSPTGFISVGPSARYIEPHSTKTVWVMLWPLPVSAVKEKTVPWAIPQMMMGIDNLQPRLDDLLLPQREPGWIRVMRVGRIDCRASASGRGVLGERGAGRERRPA